MVQLSRSVAIVSPNSIRLLMEYHLMSQCMEIALWTVVRVPF